MVESNFKKYQKVIYLKENIEAMIYIIDGVVVLNQHLDNTILTENGDVIDNVKDNEIIDKDEWIKNNRNEKINKLI